MILFAVTPRDRSVVKRVDVIATSEGEVRMDQSSEEAHIEGFIDDARLPTRGENVVEGLYVIAKLAAVLIEVGLTPKQMRRAEQDVPEFFINRKP